MKETSLLSLLTKEDKIVDVINFCEDKISDLITQMNTKVEDNAYIERRNTDLEKHIVECRAEWQTHEENLLAVREEIKQYFQNLNNSN